MKNIVKIIMGSDSDLPVMSETAQILKSFGIGYEMRILSAHRTPDDLIGLIRDPSDKDVKIYIAAAGGAAHLAGVIASHTTRPVIGVPMDSAYLKGMDSLLSTVQMPAGVPVATVAIGKPGAKNAALLAVEILAISDERLNEALKKYREKMAEDVRTKDRSLLGNNP